MEIKVLKKTPDELKIEVKGETHTFCNVLHKVLLEDKTIEMAGYDIRHPLISNPTFYIHTKEGRKPETALKDAAKEIQKRTKEFRSCFERALKEWQRK